MKKSLLKLSLVAAPFCLMLFAHCGGSEPSLTESEKATKILTQSTWTMQSVQVDGTDQTSVYAGLKITFSPSGFTATNGGAIWPASGTWQFTDQAGKTISLGNSLALTLTELTNSKLVLTLTWSETTLGGGRVKSVDGNHVFTFIK